MTFSLVMNRLVSFKTSATVLAAVAPLSLLAACDRKPEGQVVAVVNGDEVTSQEVNGELSGAANNQNIDSQTRNAALDRVIDRRLLAEEARDEGIQSSPEYILRKKKMDEMLLVQMLGEKLARDIKQPSEQQINETIGTNPQAFAERTIFDVDTIVFPKPERNDVMTQLGKTKTMDEVVSVLNRLGIKFERANAQVDSAKLPEAVFEQIKRVGTTEPFILPSGSQITVGYILASKPSPVTGRVSNRAAANSFIQKQVQSAMKKKLDQLRGKAKIKYQSGFAAPKSSSSGTPPPISPSGPALSASPAAR